METITAVSSNKGTDTNFLVWLLIFQFIRGPIIAPDS